MERMRCACRGPCGAASLSKAADEEQGCWNGWGAGSATPENDGPNPSPGAGDDQLEECY